MTLVIFCKYFPKYKTYNNNNNKNIPLITICLDNNSISCVW